MRYSAAKQITAASVSNLSLAWIFRTGKPGSEDIPIVAGGVIYITAPDGVYALVPETGKLLWTFHTVPRPGEPSADTWPPNAWKNRSGTNVWGFFTVDTKRGIVYAPIGAPTSDFYGADRLGNGLYGNSLVALDARTGELKWSRQLVHHDIWDYDLAVPPALFDIQRDNQVIPAVAQITKTGLLFVLIA